MKGRMIKSVLREYGVEWAVNRSLYSAKLKMVSTVAGTEKFFEKRVNYPTRLGIFSFDAEKIKDFIHGLPEEKKEELKLRADYASEGKILGFSSIELDYGYPINWQLNPVTGKECNIKEKWYKIPDFDMQRGDIKVTWEVSRFSHFVTLARAYLLTGSAKYYRAFSDQLAHWIRNNPYSYGANFKCGQECSLRMINGLLAYTIFKETGMATDTDKKNIETLILRCYRKVLSNFFYAYKCIKNNHTLSELVGMCIGAWCCGDEEQLSYAFRTLNEVIAEQFTEDGGYCQFSFNYERLALQAVEVILHIEDKTGHRLNGKSRDRLLNAVRLMYQCQDETGDLPNYGANDGALVFPVTSCEYRDFRPVINAVSAILSGNKVYKSGIYDEELLWFGTKEPKVYGIKQTDRVSNAFEKAGLYTIRDQNSWAMIVLNDYQSRPAHMDQLHFDLWVDGVNVLCDGGSFSYASDIGKRLGKNESHNTAVYDKKEQMNTHGRFMVYDWTKRGRVKHGGDMFYGEYQSENGYEHHREVRVTDSGYRITDEIIGEDGKECWIIFHTLCSIEKKDNRIELIDKGKRVCSLVSDQPYRLKEAYRSIYYLKKENTECIEYTGKISEGKLRIITEIITKRG